jgi:hypothetical protein
MYSIFELGLHSFSMILYMLQSITSLDESKWDDSPLRPMFPQFEARLSIDGSHLGKPYKPIQTDGMGLAFLRTRYEHIVSLFTIQRHFKFPFRFSWKTPLKSNFSSRRTCLWSPNGWLMGWAGLVISISCLRVEVYFRPNLPIDSVAAAFPWLQVQGFTPPLLCLKTKNNCFPFDNQYRSTREIESSPHRQ